jgi:Lar family restriction alleviation protein
MADNFNSDWASPPSDLIKEYIGYDFSDQTPITPELAEKLSSMLGHTPDFWLRLDGNYRADLERIGAEFLPCPFCGSTSIHVVEGSTFKWRVAECAECGARGSEERWIYTETDPDASARARVVTAWNTRP